MKTKKFKISPMRAAIIGAALTAANNVAMAAPANLTLEMVCPFPLIGDQTIIAQISADYPEVVNLQDNPTLPAISIDSITTVPDKARQGLAFVDATTITGTANSINTFRTVAGDIPNNSTLTIEPTTIPADESGPFDVPAFGDAPAQTFDESHIGTVSLTVDDLILNMRNLKANGTVAPAPVGEFSADCAIVDGQDNTLVAFEVVGETIEEMPADINVDVASVDFGSLQLGQTKTETITVSNAGDMALGINGVSIIGAGASAFLESNSCTTVTNGSSCSIEVSYTASEEGTQSATLVIESTDSEDPSVSVALTGAGQVELKPEIEVSTASIDFGTIAAGTSKTESITINNTGGAALTVSGITVNGTEFAKTADNCSTVAAGTSCAAEVTYTAIAGSSTGSVTITSDDDGQKTTTVTLAGQGEEDTGSGDGDGGDGGNGGGFVLEVPLDVNGSTVITANGGTLPLTGDIASLIDLSTGLFTGDMHLEPTHGSFEIIKGWSRYLATAQVEFEPVGITEGSLIDGKLTATSTAYVKIPKVTKTVFGLINWKIGGGENCRTKEPVTFTVTSPEGEPFDAISGGRVIGSYDLPELENCGALTSVLSSKLAGNGNTIDLIMTPVLD